MSDTNENQHAAESVFPGTTCSAWTSIAEKMPNVGRKVLVCGHYDNGNRWRATARWQPAETIDAEMWDEYPDGWEENELERVTNPNDLWLEEGVELEQYGFLENVTHWMPLPSLPNTPVEAPPRRTTNQEPT